MEQEIKAAIIFEMLGRPPEYLKEALSEFLDKVSKEEDIEIVSRKIHEPKKIEGSQDIFTTFAETEMKFKNLMALFKVIFLCLPSHIEVISPQELTIKNFDFNLLANELTRKLHQYDEIAKRLSIEREILLKQLKEQGKIPETEKINKKPSSKKKAQKKK